MITIFDTNENKDVATVDVESMVVKRTATTEAATRYLSEGEVVMIRGSEPSHENALVDEEQTTPETKSELMEVLSGKYANTPLSLQESN
jgi:hypothetical protein